MQSQEVKDYFLVVVQNCKKLMKPELKQTIEEFEIKVNLDHDAAIDLKSNNTYLNAKEQLNKIKKQRKQEQARGSK